MPADITLKVGADTTEYLAKVSQMSQAHGKVNTELDKHGTLVEKMTHGMERMLFKSIALVEVLRGVSKEFEKQRQYQMDLAKDTNASRLSSSSALVDLVGPQRLDAYESAIEGAGGIASEDQRREFLKGLQKTKGKRPLSQRMIATAFNAYTQGGEVMLPQEELLKIVDRSSDDNLQSNIDEYLTKRFNVTPDVHARNQGTVMQDAYSTLPESIKSIVRQNNRRRTDRYSDIQKTVDSGRGARLIDVQDQYERDSRENMAVGVFRRVTDIVPGTTEAGLRSTEARMARDEALEAVHRVQQQTERKTIRHDAHGESR